MSSIANRKSLMKIGLTGGIGSGKSAASARFAEHGIAVIDTDLLSRELVEPGQPALAEIIATFGDDMIDADGALDRAKLRARVFEQPDERRRLEQILHPRIRDLMLQRAATATSPYVVIVIPLLFETGQQALVDRVLLIDIPRALQHERVAARDRVDAQHVDAILAAQADRETRRAQSDDIIVNDGNIADLRRAVDALHEQYLRSIKV